MNEHQALLGISTIIVLGIAAQWLGWLLRLPSILLLLIMGFVVGPVFRYYEMPLALHPETMFGPLLLSIVSIFVGLILFEGGLSLKFSEFKQSGRIIWRLVTVGMLSVWLIGAVSAHYVVGLPWKMAFLLGAIVVVSGPTVVGPLLRHVRPIGATGPILKWEGIVIDPIGVMLAVLVFEAIAAGGLASATSATLIGLGKTLVVGLSLGFTGAGVLIFLFKRYWVPDYLESPVSIMMVVAIFTLSNHLMMESGLFSTTVMGVIMANQKWVSIKHIVEFKENLRVLLISTLFIILAARLELEPLSKVGVEGFAFLAILIFVARPICVAISTWGSDLTWQDRVFITAMAPRGIVAAAASSIFALQLAKMEFPGAELLVPYTFLVITGTVAIYGLLASPIARWLQVSKPNPQGILMVGAQRWSRELAKMITEEGIQVILCDTNWKKLHQARMEGVETYLGSIINENILEDEMELGGIGRIVALTSNDDINSLACLHFEEVFGRSQVFQLPPVSEGSREQVTSNLKGRLLFGEKVNYEFIQKKLAGGGWILRRTSLTKEFTYENFQDLHNGRAIPLVSITADKRLFVATVDENFNPTSGQTLLTLCPLTEEELEKKDSGRFHRSDSGRSLLEEEDSEPLSQRHQSGGLVPDLQTGPGIADERDLSDPPETGGDKEDNEPEEQPDETNEKSGEVEEKSDETKESPDEKEDKS